MKLGACTTPANIEKAAEAGFDYLECSLSFVHGMSEEDFQALAARVPSLPIPITKANGFAPGSLKLTGPDANVEEWHAYLEKALSRAKKLGIKLLVLGSSAARNIPEGWDVKTGLQQFKDFLLLAGEYAEKYDIDIALEPLRRKESNFMNLVSEGMLFAAWADHPRINVLADTFHMHCCREPFSSMAFTGKYLHHVHVSSPKPDESGRIYPFPGDGVDYAGIINTLKEMNYEGDVSIEAAFEDLVKEGKVAIEILRPLMEG